jgi:hypothetical protein
MSYHETDSRPIYTFIGLIDIDDAKVAEFVDDRGEKHRVNESSLVSMIPNWEKSSPIAADEHKAALAAIKNSKLKNQP